MPTLAGMAEAVGTLLKERSETAAASESSTGGLIAAALLAVPGASAYFIGGAVIYTHRAREALLEVRLGGHPGMRASTEPYALLCARTVRERLGATWGLGESGAAGPGGNRHGDAPGHCCIAVTGPRTRLITLETGQADREANMWPLRARRWPCSRKRSAVADALRRSAGARGTGAAAVRGACL